MTAVHRWGLRLDPGSASLRAAWIAAYRRLEARRPRLEVRQSLSYFAVADSDHCHGHGDHGHDLSPGGKVGNGVAHFLLGREVRTPVHTFDRIGRVIGRIGGLST
jgi:hypothetical protein